MVPAHVVILVVLCAELAAGEAVCPGGPVDVGGEVLAELRVIAGFEGHCRAVDAGVGFQQAAAEGVEFFGAAEEVGDEPGGVLHGGFDGAQFAVDLEQGVFQSALGASQSLFLDLLAGKVKAQPEGR